MRELAGEMVVWVTGKELAAELAGKELAAECGVSSVCDSDEVLVPLRIIDHDVPSA